MAKKFSVGDLVWAKMKGFSPWPATITLTDDQKFKKNTSFYVKFFGTYDHAWIQQHNIEPHSLSMLENVKYYKKISASLKTAVKEIRELVEAHQATASTIIKEELVSPPPSPLPVKSRKRRVTSKKPAHQAAAVTVIKKEPGSPPPSPVPVKKKNGRVAKKKPAHRATTATIIKKEAPPTSTVSAKKKRGRVSKKKSFTKVQPKRVYKKKLSPKEPKKLVSKKKPSSKKSQPKEKKKRVSKKMPLPKEEESLPEESPSKKARLSPDSPDEFDDIDFSGLIAGLPPNNWRLNPWLVAQRLSESITDQDAPSRISKAQITYLGVPSTSRATAYSVRSNINPNAPSTSGVIKKVKSDINLDIPSTSTTAIIPGVVSKDATSVLYSGKSDIQSEPIQVGFLGLGAMGRQIVERLLSTNHQMTVWNRTKREELDYLRKNSAKFASSPMDVINDCDITFCCLDNAASVKQVVYGKCGVLKAFNDSKCNGKAYVEMSTIHPSLCEKIAEDITSKGGKYLEATMLGERDMVASAEMVIVASGDVGVFSSCQQMFSFFSKGAVFLGLEVGLGNKMSAITNMWAGAGCAAISQIMDSASCEGVPPEFLLELLRQGPCSCPMLIRQATAMISKDDTVHTPIKHQVKNLSIAISLGSTFNQPLVLAATAKNVFVSAMKEHSEEDVSVIFKKMSL